MSGIDQKTADAPRGAPNTEALTPAKLAELAPPPVTRPIIPSYAEAQKLLGEAERALQAAQLAENRAHLAAQIAARDVTAANQAVKAACRVYDLALQQERARAIDPAARPRAAAG